MCKIQERRQQRTRLDLPARYELRNRKCLDRAAARRSKCNGGVGRSEIDPDDETRAQSSTSAGAKIYTSSPSTARGNVMLRARHPGCFSVPTCGGVPRTLPVNLIALGS